MNTTENNESSIERHECQNCGKRWKADDLNEIEDFSMRVNAGEPCPSGECPKCGCLCHPVTKETNTEGKRQVEIAYLYEDGTWATDFVEVPTELVEREAIVSWVEQHRLPQNAVAAQLYSIST